MSIATTEPMNLAMFVAGVSGAGKTTYVNDVARDWLERGGWVFVHDMTRSFAVPHFKSWAEYLAAAAANIDEATGFTKLRIAGFSCKWSELVAGMKDLARQLNSEKNIRFPMLLICDEAAQIDSSGKTYIGEEDKDLFGLRRHYGIAIVVNMQRVTDLMESFWGRLTDIILFRLGAAVDAQIIERGAEFPKGTLAAATKLDQFDFLHVLRGFDNLTQNPFTDEPLWRVPA